MDLNLCLSVILLGLTLVSFVLGRMRVLKPKVYIPFIISALLFMALYGTALATKFLVPALHLSPQTNRLLFEDAGSGLLGLLPIALLTCFAGRYILKMGIDEQWNGTVRFTRRSVRYGLIAGLVISAISLTAIYLSGQKFGFRIDLHKYSINLVTNLYEEIITRGLLLACCLRYWNKLAGVVWTSLVFGLMHGFNEKALFIALTSALMARAVLKARSLWAGWVAHQTADMIIDTLVL